MTVSIGPCMVTGRFSTETGIRLANFTVLIGETTFLLSLEGNTAYNRTVVKVQLTPLNIIDSVPKTEEPIFQWLDDNSKSEIPDIIKSYIEAESHLHKTTIPILMMKIKRRISVLTYREMD